MSRDVNIFLSGGMGSLSFEEQTKWRSNIKNEILFGDCDYKYNPVFFDPTMHYTYEEKLHKSEKEVFDYDTNALRKSDLVIVNFNDLQSVGTIMEIAIAHEHRIPIIGLNKDGAMLHPWFECCCTRICDDMREVVDYVVSFFLN